MTALFERLSARLGAAVPLAVPGLQLVPKGAIALAEHVNRYYRVFTGADPQNVAVRLPTGGGSFEVRHSATNAALLRVTDAGLDFPAGGIGTVELADGSVTSAKILDNEIVNADINAVANILVTKLAPIGAGNVLRSNGTTNIAGPIVAGDIAAGAVTSAKILDNEIVDGDINAAANIAVAKLLHVGAGNVLKSNGTANVGGQVVNADIAPAGTAQIAVNKLLHVGAGNVLRSDGAQNVAGQVVTGDIANGTILDADINAAANINGSKLLDNSVSSAKLSGGLSVPANSITTAEIADGTIVNVDINAAAAIALAKLAPGTAGLLKSNGTAISAGNQAATADIANLAVDTPQIAANAVTAFSSATIPQPVGVVNTTGWVSISGPNASLTNAAGQSVLLFASGMLSNNAVPQVTYMALTVDGVQQAAYAGGASTVVSAVLPFALVQVVTPAAGTHSYGLAGQISGGNGLISTAAMFAVLLKK